MFKRRRNDAEEADLTDDDTSTEVEDEEVQEVEAPIDRGDGPYDLDEAPDDDMARIDFGSLAVPGVNGMDVSLEVDQESQAVIAITIVIGEGAVQLQPFAAPRSGGFWPEVRMEMKTGITASGGTIDEQEGPFGQELLAVVPGQDENGQAVMQDARFVGVEGPRWLLRGVFLGAAAKDQRAAEVLEDVFRGCVVDRGAQPMAPGELLPLRLPDEAVAAEEQGEPERPPLDPFERGPEITEIR